MRFWSIVRCHEFLVPGREPFGLLALRSTLTALQVMADKKTTFLVVLDQGQMVGVVARRGFWQDHRAFGIFQGDRNRSHDHSIDC